MAISDTQKVDYLWKKIAYGVTKTDLGTAKQGFEESIASPLLIRGDRIWQQSGSIPASIATSSSVVTVYSGSTTVECTEDTTAADNRTWKTNLTDWISPEFGADYLVSVYIFTSGITGSNKTTQVTISANKITAAGVNDDQWYFDYQSGVLHFIGTNIPTAITTGVNGKSIYITGARYTGGIGFGTSSTTTATTATLGNLYIAGNTLSSTDTNANINLSPNGTGNVVISANVSAGNIVTANYFVGNGSLLTGVTASSATTAVSAYKLANGSSNVNIATLDGNITVSVGGIANTVVFANTGNYITTTGNLNASYLFGNGSQLTGIVSSYGNSNVATYLPTYIGNISAGNANLGNLVTANYFSGNGSLLTSLTGSNVSGNVTYAITSNWANIANSVTFTNVSSKPTTISGYGITDAYSNTNAGAYLTSYSGDLSGGNLTLSGNLIIGGTTTRVNSTVTTLVDPIFEIGGNANGTTLSTDDNKDRGLLLHYYSGSSAVDAFIGWDDSNVEFGIGSNVSLTSEVVTWNSYGNVRASYFLGNGSQLTGITRSYGNSNVATYLAAYTGNLTASNVSFTGANVSLGSVSNLHIDGGTSGYFLTTDGSGGLSWGAQSSLTATADQFTANGTDTTFTLSVTPAGKTFTVVAIQGVLQPKSSYSLMGPQLTFDFSPPASAFIEVTTFGGSVGGGGSGGSSLTWNIASSNATMSTNNGYFVNTSSAAKTMTLPTSATLGDTIRINDLAGSFSTNNLTVARNGHKIQGVAQDLLVDVDQSSFGLVYSNSTYGWKVLEL